MVDELGMLGEPVRKHSPNDRDMYLNDETHSCGVNVIYCDVYDAFYCSECDVWTEGVCGDADCPYCPGRPDLPSQSHTSGTPADMR